MSEVKEFFNNLAEKWDSICNHDENKISAVITLAGVKSGDKVIDIACGTGILFAETLKRNPSEILGIDISDKMLEKAKLKFDDKRLRLVAENLFSIHETDYDVAIVYSAYPHFEEKQRLAEHINSVLKVGGRMIIAHSESKEKINLRHRDGAQDVSSHLKSTDIEKIYFEPYFKIDTEVDTNDMYVISGTKL